MTKTDQEQVVVPVHEKMALGGKADRTQHAGHRLCRDGVIRVRRKVSIYLPPTPAVVGWMDNAHTNAACYQPVRMPHAYEPMDWRSLYGGGQRRREISLKLPGLIVPEIFPWVSRATACTAPCTSSTKC